MDTLLKNKYIELLTYEWFLALEYYLRKSNEFTEIAKIISKERREHIVFPQSKDVFNAFKYTSYSNVKMVVLNQSPYYNGFSNGLAFGVNENCIKIPFSSKELVKVVEGGLRKLCLGFDYTFKSWASQGVLMLNCELTVKKDKPGEYLETWSPFIKAVLHSLQPKEFIVYLLLGNYAHTYDKYITNPKHKIIKVPHPSEILTSGATIPLKTIQDIYGELYCRYNDPINF